MFEPTFDVQPTLLGLPAAAVIMVAGIIGCVVGSVWLLRISRETQEPNPPPWRYRARHGWRARIRALLGLGE